MRITRNLFLRARTDNYREALALASPHDIIIEPDDEIICDFCNAEIQDALVIKLVDRGRMATCDDCLNRINNICT